MVRSNTQNRGAQKKFDGAIWHVAQREAQHKIKVLSDTPKAKSKNEAEALTSAGLPDMRFARDKELFSDPRRRVSDGKLDRRFLVNRPDLVEAHRQRNERANFIFTDDMLPENADIIEQEVENAAEELDNE